MALPLLAAAVIAVLALGYRLYGRWVARQFSLDDATVTPAHRLEDGVDFVPTRPFYLFGQHFSAIAAAGPIVGPILACQQFGWLPCILWIAVASCSSAPCTTCRRSSRRCATTRARSPRS